MTSLQKREIKRLKRAGCKHREGDPEYVVWFGNHCFMVTPDGVVEEL